jgi:hypothetical protein
MQTGTFSVCGTRVTLAAQCTKIAVNGDVTGNSSLRLKQVSWTLYSYLADFTNLFFINSIDCSIMPFLRPASLLRSAARPVAVRPAFIARTQVRFATQDYGSGDGNPAGEKPQQQGQNPSEDIEHPGPPPPKVARGQSSSESKPGQQSQSNDGASKTGSGSGKSVNGAQPKILNENTPATESEDVKQHNEEMEQRAEKAHEQVDKEGAEKDKVSKSFWAGKSRRTVAVETWGRELTHARTRRAGS